MPRSSVLLTAEPVDAQAVAVAAGAVWERLTSDQPDVDEFMLLPVEDGAALQVLGSDDLLLTVLRPVVLRTHDEIVRLLPHVDPAGLPAPVVWTPALTPWTPGGMLGVAILEEAAARASGMITHAATS